MSEKTRKGRMSGCLLLTLAALGVAVAVPTLWVIVSVTATPLYPDPGSVPSAMNGAPAPRWADAAERARRIVRESVTGQNLPGVSVAVGIDGAVVWAEGFGYADLWTGTPVTPDHRFRIGTASAALTSAAAGLLLEEGRLKLDDEIQAYVPEFPRKQWPVTVRDLMAHTAGLKVEGGRRESMLSEHCERPVEALRFFAEEPLLFKPGAEARFSSYGWVLVSAAIEAAAKRPFLDLMRERIFDPVAMTQTVADQGPGPEAREGEDFPLFILKRELFHDPGATLRAAPEAKRQPVQGEATSYYPRFRKDPKYGMHVTRLLDYSCFAGSSAFVTTPSDLVRFAMAFQAGKLLKPETVALLQAPRRLESGALSDYGMGWRVRTVTLAGRPARVVGHDGDSMGGMVATLITAPGYGITVAVTSNIAFAGTAALADKIAEAFVERK